MALLSLSPLILLLAISIPSHGFKFEEATIDGIRSAFASGELTSRQLVEHYAHQIQLLNPTLRAVIELNPDALEQAERADWERRTGGRNCGGLHGIPILLKDTIATQDRLNTTAGSLALLGSVVRSDSTVVRKLRWAGAVILGKASMSEWAGCRSLTAPPGWSARGGQGANPYVSSASPCGSSSGSAIAVAANMVAVSLGTETDGSIVCPAAVNSVVGIKPTVGLTSRAGVVPISPRQDTIGPICRTVADAVEVLEAIVGLDDRDADATRAASKYIPETAYKQFLKVEGLKGKRLGILRNGFFDFPNGSIKTQVFEEHFNTMRQKGAILIDNLGIANISTILDFSQNGEFATLPAEFKLSLNKYLSELLYSPVGSLLDVINFNNNHSVEERMDDIGQFMFLVAQSTNGLGPVEEGAIAKVEEGAIAKMVQLSEEGLERLMKEKQLDAVITPDSTADSVFAINGYPAIAVPAGYGEDGVPFGICFGGLKGAEPELIEIAYGFEQATRARKPPTFDTFGKYGKATERTRACRMKRSSI